MHNIKRTLTTLALAMICFIGIGSMESAFAIEVPIDDVPIDDVPIDGPEGEGTSNIWIGTDGNQMTDEEISYWQYTKSGGEIILSRYTGSIVEGKIVGCVPATINGKPVTKMSGTFNGCTNLTTAPTIPSSVTNMYCTFNGCTNLTTAPVIPSSVTSMTYTFNECTSLTTAPTIPNSVTDMSYTFSDCTSLTTAPEISSSVTNMSYTFYGCTSLTTAPTIPNSVTIMDNTFQGCTSLTTAPEIPSSVTNMNYTFNGCTSLTTAPTIPNSVTSMDGTFWGCTSLTGDVVIPDSVTSMPDVFTSTSKPITLVYTSNNTAVPAASFPSNVTLRLVDSSSTGSGGTGGSGLPVENGKGDGNMAVYGNVEPIIMIDITVPVTGIQFTINADRTIRKIDAEIVSNSPSPIVVYVVSAGVASLSAEEASVYNIGGAPALVADDTFEDWNNLTKAETKANIAISINGHNISTASEGTPIEICQIDSAYGEDASGNFQANTQRVALTESILYGKGWDNSADLAFKYDTVLEFAIP